VLPLYFVCDEGRSMAGESITAVNDGIAALFKALSMDSVVDAKARVSIIAFSDSAELILPLSRISDVVGVPRCSVGGPSSFSAAFRKTKEQIDVDVADLKERNLRVLRPVVFFISDGVPNDESWISDHALLTDSANKYRPHIISFGVAGAQVDVIRDVATSVDRTGKRFAFVEKESGSKAIPKAIMEVLRSIQSGNVIGESFASVEGLSAITEDLATAAKKARLQQHRLGTPEMSNATNLGNEPVDNTRVIDSGGVQVLPFYIVCDEGESMAGESINAVNDGITAVFKALSADPVVDAKARVSIIAFAESAEVILPLSQISSIATGVPGCSVRGPSSYSAAFRKTKEQIDIDLAGLRAQNLHVLRPVVFFISDGVTRDELWQSEHAALTDDRYRDRPHIISFGVAGAQADVIRDVATPVDRAGKKKFAWKADDGTNPGPALTEIFKFTTPDCYVSLPSHEPMIVEMDIPGVVTLDDI